MGVLFKKYKTKFRYALKPVFAMLSAKKKELSPESWMELTQRSYQSVLSNPVEFLGNDLPAADLTRDVVDEIFKEFHKDLRSRAPGLNN